MRIYRSEILESLNITTTTLNSVLKRSGIALQQVSYSSEEVSRIIRTCETGYERSHVKREMLVKYLRDITKEVS